MLDTIGKRLKKARKHADMTQIELASAVDAKQGAISDLENGRNNSSTKLVQMAICTGVNAEWLSTGKGEMVTVSNDEATAMPHMIPVLNYTEVTNNSSQDNFTKAFKLEPVQGEYDHPENLYWVRVQDNSMSPTFNPSNLVLINTVLLAQPGNYVLALEKRSDSVVFRRWRLKEVDNATKQSYSQLIAINPDYPTIDSRSNNFEILGVAIEHRIKLT